MKIVKNKKGFTLIELLAVIVILAIIALIATPIILSIIEDVRKSSALRSAELYVKSANETIVKYEMNTGNSIDDGEYKVNSDGDLELNLSSDMTLRIDIENSKPTSGMIEIYNGTIHKIKNLNINNYLISTDKNGNLAILTVYQDYQNGEIVYFDVSKGKECKEEEYKNSLGTYEVRDGDDLKTISDYGNSKSGYNGINNKDGNQNSCLKFYVIKDTDNTLTMILDHNTTTYIEWNSEDENSNGPVELLEQLKSDTNSWKGTNTPSNYTYKSQAGTYVDVAGAESYSQGISYTIDYTGYKARLITANEVVRLAKNDDFEETISDGNIKFDLRTRFNSTSEIEENIGWLYDRLSRNSDYSSGMPNYNINNDPNPEYGYWTSSAVMNSYAKAWYVNCTGNIISNNVFFADQNGVRPVIEIPKKNLF